jgi:hypothetical protein
MLPFSILAILPPLIGTPEWPLYPSQAAELGGTVVARTTGEPFPSPVPITLNLYSGRDLVATAQADLFGRYALVSPPGDYWLQVNVGGNEESIERILLRAGSWQRDFRLPTLPLTFVAWAADETSRHAEVCGRVRATNGVGATASVLAYSDVSCIAGGSSAPDGRYCLSLPPGGYWLKAVAGGVDVAYERVSVPAASVSRDMQSAIEMINLPPVRVTGRPGAAHVSG